MLSLISHADRYSAQNEHIPYEDQILISPYLAGYGKRAWIDESKNIFMGEIELADNENGRTIKDMLKKGFDVGTSMSVSATADNKYYYVDDILSLGDFTLRPDLEAKVVKIDFSEKIAPNGKSNLVTFSQVIKNKDIICSFSEDNSDETDETDDVEFETPKHTVSISGVRRESTYSQSNCERPKVTTQDAKVDVTKMTPVDNTNVGQNEVVTNLNSTVEGTDVECINPEYFNSKLFSSLGIQADDNFNVSMEDIHKDIPVEDQLTKADLAQLPTAMSDAVAFSVKTNFTIQQYLKERDLPPHAVLRRRVNEIIQICRSKKQGWIDNNIDKLKAYFESYLFTWVSDSINRPGDDFNIMIKLRMTIYGIANKIFRDLRLAIKRMKEEVGRTGFITKPTQQRLNTAFQEMVNGMYAYIDDKLKSSGVTFIPKTETEEKEEK